MKQFQNTVYIFSEFNPFKKFNTFCYESYSNFSEALLAHCTDGTILKISDSYFIFKGIKHNYTETSQPSKIQFKRRTKILYERNIR